MNFLEDAIRESQTIAITGHTSPDGDCVGSCMGLYNYILNKYPNKKVNVYLESIAESYKRVKRTEEIQAAMSEPEVYELMISLDNSQIDRMTKGMRPYFDRALKTINIDHHVSNTKFAQINHVISTASSACEVLYDLLDEDYINLETAEALYMGIICDSGVFKYSSTTEHTMNIGGKLLNKGVDAADWIDGVFYERSYVQALLLGQALLNSQRLLDNKVIYSVVTREMFENLQAKPDDLEGIIEQLRLTKGVEVAILISERESNECKYSFRSKKYVDVNQTAGHLGGGGHIRAAGCTVKGSWKDSFQIFIKDIEGQLNAHV